MVEQQTRSSARVWRRQIGRASIIEERESDNMNRCKGRRAKGQVFENLRENKFEDLYGVIVWFPEPRTSRAGKSGALTSVYFVRQLAMVSATQRM